MYSPSDASNVCYLSLRESDRITLENSANTLTTKRGGAKYGGAHLALLIISTLLLTVAAIFLIKDMNVLGIITLVLGMLARLIDTRI